MSSPSKPPRRTRSLARRVTSLLLTPLLLLPLLVGGLLITAPTPALAASGGRIGGGSFRSSPMPRSYGGGGYRGGYGGGYRGGYGGGFGGGGLGFPFLIPIFGFGGGGLFGFLILMAVVGLLLNAVRGGGNGNGNGLPDGRGGDLAYPTPDGPVSIAQVQIGLLASARELQDDLRRYAASADTATNAGLQQVLQDATLALMRHPERWVYASSEEGSVPFAAAESTFNRLAMQERSKLSRELTANVSGRRFSEPSPVSAGSSDAASDYIAVTLLVASRRSCGLKGADTADTLRDSLQRLGSIPVDDLLAIEVIWQPEGAGEVLSSEELITAYPDLQHL
ncbi:MAG: DUF1517 domain-containing protein [Synechococcaceae cyanobacterium]|nr:DUF1517 domain-containing protein [Synechococcaceae cyanobacterium]